MKSKTSLGCFICLIVIWLGGCGIPKEEQPWENSVEEQLQEEKCILNENPIDISEAKEISFETGGTELSDLLYIDFLISKGETDVEKGAYSEIGELARNEMDIFYVKSFGKEGAQFHYLNQIYRYAPDRNEDVLIYETSEAVWLNEFLANSTYLYWVEYVYAEEKGSYDYNVMQYNPTTEEIACIATRNDTESEEICLAVSDKYVAWYDSYLNGEVKIIVYNVVTQEMQLIEDTAIQKYMPYERLNIVDERITFFTQDDDNIYINCYDLETMKTDILLLGNKRDFDKLAGCFSNAEYIGWLTEYSYGTYYFYNTKNGELYSLSQSDSMRVFSGWLSKYFYINDSVSGNIYVYDLASGEVYYQDVVQGTALSLKPYGEKLYMKVVGDENVEMLTIRTNF